MKEDDHGMPFALSWLHLGTSPGARRIAASRIIFCSVSGQGTGNTAADRLAPGVPSHSLTFYSGQDL